MQALRGTRRDGDGDGDRDGDGGDGAFEAPKASWELRFAYKIFVALDFKALEVVGASKSDQESPKKLPKRP